MPEKLQIVPSNDFPVAHSTAESFSAPSAPGVYDTLRSSLLPESSSQPLSNQPQCQSKHPLESRLVQWEATQTNLRYAMMRRQFGLTSTLGMEMQMFALQREESVMPRVLDCVYKIRGGRSIHRDILTGNDCSLDWEDVFTGADLDPMSDIHLEMDRRMGVGH